MKSDTSICQNIYYYESAQLKNHCNMQHIALHTIFMPRQVAMQESFIMLSDLYDLSVLKYLCLRNVFSILHWLTGILQKSYIQSANIKESVLEYLRFLYLRFWMYSIWNNQYVWVSWLWRFSQKPCQKDPSLRPRACLPSLSLHAPEFIEQEMFGFPRLPIPWGR